ncbi:hypothetical protein BS47DRAFT_377745 [Hydnum rufescens UP504]|uniref:Uncharacterized protein n=1 Tax=Hydnum rufescens UP504 TaxID=1448309 RepID=A0A9P6B739_9AGAM|nr:hypothetical protein BS47DRAFT_377745 [Hydnum rufescens UP504]
MVPGPRFHAGQLQTTKQTKKRLVAKRRDSQESTNKNERNTVGDFGRRLAATAVYYSFSYSIQDSTRVSRAKLHILSTELATLAVDPLGGPLPASARITHSDFTSLLKARWNNDIEGLFTRARDVRVDVPWGKVWEQYNNFSGVL